MLQYDDVLKDIGGFGPFQWRHWLGSCLVSFSIAIIFLVQVFIGGQSDHWCQAPELDIVNCTKWSLDEFECEKSKKTVAIPLADSDSEYEYENCIRYNLTGIDQRNWYPGWRTSDVTNVTMACDAGWVYDTSQFQTTIITEFNLVCNKDDLPDFAQSMFFVGVLIGSALFGAMSDWIGRYKTFGITLVLSVTTGAFTAMSTNYTMYVIVRIIAGAAWQGLNLCTFILITEVVDPSKRATQSAIANFWYCGGYMFLALAGFLIRQWRILMFVAASPVLLLVLQFALLSSESPRWLLSKGRTKEARHLIRKIARINNKELPTDYFKQLKNRHKQNITAETLAEQGSIRDIFKYRNLLVKTVILLILWCVISLEYYGLSLSTGDLGSDFYLSFFISGAVELPAYLWVLFAIDYFGRKPNQVGSTILGGIACIVAYFIPSGVWRTTAAMIGKFFATIAFSVVYVYTAEQFPTPIRNAGIGICSTFGRIGSISAPLLFALGDVWEPLPYVFFGSCAIFGGLLALYLPETNKRNLLQTIIEGEEFGKKKKSNRKQKEKDVELQAHTNKMYERDE